LNAIRPKRLFAFEGDLEQGHRHHGCPFPNEAQMVHDMGGIMLRVNRPGSLRQQLRRRLFPTRPSGIAAKPPSTIGVSIT